MKTLIKLVLLILIATGAKSQTGPPLIKSTLRAIYGYVQADSGMIVARRDTAWTPLLPGTMVYWANASADSSFWYYSAAASGPRWTKVGIGAGGSVTGLTASNTGGFTFTITNPSSTPNIALTLRDAIADGTTKGQATFASGDFNSVNGLMSLDYPNMQVASGSQAGILSIALYNTLNGKENVLSFNAPLVRATNSISINFGAADGVNAGVFTGFPSDFDATGGLLKLDYVNGQKANHSQSGFLSSTDWDVFTGLDSVVVTNAGTSGFPIIFTNSLGDTLYGKKFRAGTGISIVQEIDSSLTVSAIPGGALGYATIQEEGSSLTQRATLNFIGAGVTATDNGGSTRTDVTFTAASNSVAGYVSLGAAQKLGTGTKIVDTFIVNETAYPTSTMLYVKSTAGSTAPVYFKTTGTADMFVRLESDSRAWAEGVGGSAGGASLPGSYVIRDLGAPGTRFSINTTGQVTINNLSGSGNRITIASAAGLLSTAVIGSGLGFDGTTLTGNAASAPGSDKQIAYNKLGAFAASPDFLYDSTLKKLTLDSNTFTKNKYIMLGDMSSNNPTLIEFRRNFGGIESARGQVGILGGAEFNQTSNMDYTTGSHKYFDNTKDAIWSYMQPDVSGAGWGLQWVKRGHPNDETMWSTYGRVMYSVDLIPDGAGEAWKYGSRVNMQALRFWSPLDETKNINLSYSGSELVLQGDANLNRFTFKNNENNGNALTMLLLRTKAGSFTLTTGTNLQFDFNTVAQYMVRSTASAVSGISLFDHYWTTTNPAGTTADRARITQDGDYQILTGGITLVKTRGASSSDIALLLQDNSAAQIVKITGDGATSLNGKVGVSINAQTTASLTIGVSNYNSGNGTSILVNSGSSNNPITAASGTVATMAMIKVEQLTETATNTGVVYTNDATLWITGAPVAGSNVTITNPWSIYVAAGKSLFGAETRVSAGDFWVTQRIVPQSGDFGVKIGYNSNSISGEAYTSSWAEGTLNINPAGADVIIAGQTAVGGLKNNGREVITLATTGDANYSVGANDLFVTASAITAGRNFALPSVLTGRLLIIGNKNASGNAWTFTGRTVKDLAGNTISTMVNTSPYWLLDDGTNFIKIN